MTFIRPLDCRPPVKLSTRISANDRSVSTFGLRWRSVRTWFEGSGRSIIQVFSGRSNKGRHRNSLHSTTSWENGLDEQVGYQALEWVGAEGFAWKLVIFRLVSSWMACEGYSKSMASFCNAAKLVPEEGEQSIETRKGWFVRGCVLFELWKLLILPFPHLNLVHFRRKGWRVVIYLFYGTYLGNDRFPKNSRVTTCATVVNRSEASVLRRVSKG